MDLKIYLAIASASYNHQIFIVSHCFHLISVNTYTSHNHISLLEVIPDGRGIINSWSPNIRWQVHHFYLERSGMWASFTVNVKAIHCIVIAEQVSRQTYIAKFHCSESRGVMQLLSQWTLYKQPPVWQVIVWT